jgi:hypothetical protein
MNDFVTKPFQPEELRKKMFQYMQRKSEEAELPVNLNLEPFTLGDDVLGRQLCELLLENLDELHEALKKSLVSHNASFFDKAHHKCKTALQFVDDPLFADVIETISIELRNNEVPSARLQNLETQYEQWKKRIQQTVKKTWH